MDDRLKRDILSKIREVAGNNGGKPPGVARFEATTGVKRHEWQGKIWRNWSDAIVEAGFAPNDLQGAWDEEEILRIIAEISKAIGRFPSSSDLKFELHHRPNSPNPKTVLAKWNMSGLAAALTDYAGRLGEQDVEAYARAYTPPKRGRDDDTDTSVNALGYVYMQRHGADYKIGFTSSLNKRGRQIQIELPQEIELVHSILTDDPAGVESYWHKRFATKRTRGEWFKLTKADVSAFKRWSKIW